MVGLVPVGLLKHDSTQKLQKQLCGIWFMGGGLKNEWILNTYVTYRRELTPYVMSLLAPSDSPKMRLVIYLKGDHKFFHQGFPALN